MFTLDYRILKPPSTDFANDFPFPSMICNITYCIIPNCIYIMYMLYVKKNITMCLYTFVGDIDLTASCIYSCIVVITASYI